MPLIRYHTGDEACFLSEPCPCGTALRRLGRINGRIAEPVRLPQGSTLSIRDLDQALLPLPGLLGYQAQLEIKERESSLFLTLYATHAASAETLSAQALHAVASTTLARLPDAERPRLKAQAIAAWPWASQGPVKSRIVNNACNT